jgi:hypothetical protein
VAARGARTRSLRTNRQGALRCPVTSHVAHHRGAGRALAPSRRHRGCGHSCAGAYALHKPAACSVDRTKMPPRPNVLIGQSMPNELSHVSHAFCSSPRRRLLQHWEKTRLSIELRTYFTNRHLPKRFGSRRGSDCPAENSGNRTLLPVKYEAERRGSSNECRILETARRGVRGPNYPG